MGLRAPILLSLLSVAGLWAEEPALPPTQYQIDEWAVSTGFPEETVLDMARQPNSFLWLGTAHGLLRFDGRQFVPSYPDSVQSVVWTVGLNEQQEVHCAVTGVGVQRLRGRTFETVWAHPLGRGMGPVLRPGRDGRFLVLDGTELYREDGGGYTLWQRLPAPGRLLAELEPGVWAVATIERRLEVIRGPGQPAESYPLPSVPEAILADGEGGVWVGTATGLAQFERTPGGLRARPPVVERLAISSLARGTEGTLWLGTHDGLYRYRDGVLDPFTANVGQRRERISSLSADTEGNVWAAYGDGGLFRVRPPRFRNWWTREGVAGPVVRSVQHDGLGGAWVAGTDGVVQITAGGQVRRVPGSWRDFSAWLMVWEDPRHLLVLGQQEMRRIDTATLAASPVALPKEGALWPLLFRRRSGEIWVGNREGEIFALREGRWQRVPIAGLPKAFRTEVMAEGRDGTLWLAAVGEGLFRIEDGRAVPVAADDPEQKQIHTLYVDSQDTLWVGFHGAGVGRLRNGHFDRMVVDGPSQRNSAYFLAEDLTGHLWIGLRAGLARVSLAALREHLDGRGPAPAMSRYTSDSGLTSGNFGVAGLRSHTEPAEVIWMPHLRGIVRIDSGHLVRFEEPPPVQVDQIWADGKVLAAEGQEWVVPPHSERIRFGFTAPFLPEPLRVRYRHQLVGFESEPVGPHNEPHATFTKLPPGDYTFRVWAGNGDEVWTPQPAVVRVRVAPAWFETILFRVALLAGAVSAVALFVWWRMRVYRRDKAALERRVLERTAELEMARQSAESASRVKADFLATMSHEIRTPLHGVLGTLELLANRPLEGEDRDYVRTARRSGESLLELLNNVLDLSRLEAGRAGLRAEPFETRELFADVAETFQDAAVMKGLDLRLRLDPALPARLTGDLGRLRQVLSNLVGNAVKFTDSGFIEIGAEARPAGAGSCRLAVTVTDSGVGIAAPHLDSLFEPFSQADSSTTRRHSGTGLGLAICYRLIAEMGGRLTVRSERGAGSEFAFEVTLPEAPAADPAQAEREHPAGSQPLHGRVLLVEDNRVNQMVASRMLAMLGCTVDIAADGVEGVERAAERDYDVILMDCHMPRASGTEATARIRAGQGAKAAVPIIALTASASNEERAACLAAGMNGFLAKPYALLQLREALAQYLSIQGVDGDGV